MPNKHCAIAAAALLGSWSLSSLGQEPGHEQACPEASDEASHAQFIEEILVVGTRRAGREIDTLPVPVDILDAEQLGAQGNGDMLDALASLIPSYNVGREPISDAATLVRPANLRGLPADSTLVLVNGKRRHRSAVIGEFISGINKGAQGVDLVPLAGIAVKQVELLRDGASAQYGSDAIAGVLNFVLEDDPETRRLQVELGSTYEGDGDQVAVAGSLGTSLGFDGFATLSFEFKDSSPTSRGSQDPQATRLKENGYAPIADPVVIWGAPEVEDDFKVLFNAESHAGEGHLYGFGIWSGRKVDGSFFYRNPNTRRGVFADATGENLLVADLAPNDGVSCLAVPVIDGLADPALKSAVIADPNCFIYSELFPGGFTPRFGGEVSDVSAALGWRSELESGLGIDLSLSAGRNEAVYRIRNTVNASYGPNTPVAFELGKQVQFERLVNLDFTYQLDVGGVSDLNIAFGAQYHKEVFEIAAGQTESWAPGGFESQGFSVGSNGFQGFNADVAGEFGRDSYAAYVDLDLDVTQAWLLSGALRYEKFSDFGDTTNGKLATRYSLSPSLALRGAVSTGFRAPSVGQSNLRRAATTFSGGRLVESLTLPPTNPVAMLKGGRQLQPEESVNLSFGAVFALGEVQLSLDWFRIEVEGRIALTQQDLTDRDRAELLASNIVGAETVTAVTFFVNDIDSETSGLDLVAQTNVEFIGGRLGLSLALNVTDTRITDAGVTLSAAATRELEDALPRQRVTLTLDYLRGPWRGVLRVNHYGDVYEHLFNDEGIPVSTDSMAVVDLEVSRELWSGYKLAFGVKNVFDSVPDKHQYAGLAGYAGLDFPANHPNGFNGGSYYLRLTGEW